MKTKRKVIFRKRALVKGPLTCDDCGTISWLVPGDRIPTRLNIDVPHCPTCPSFSLRPSA